MSRRDFRPVLDVPIDDILLDVDNARIRAGKDQADCIARILRKEDQLMALMESIAKEGLTTVPILVSQADDGRRWTVRDGNRRVTSIKLLNNPELAPDARLKVKIRALSKQYRNNIDGSLDLLASDNEEAILREVVARHSGAQGGIGQLDWSAYLRTVYLMHHGHPAEYKRAGQYVFWAEEQGVSVEDEFPISTVHRFFTQENLAALGFKIVKDELQPTLSVAQAKGVAQRVIMDFQLGPKAGGKNVDDVRSPARAEAYILEVRTAAGLPAPKAQGGATTGKSAAAGKGSQPGSTGGSTAGQAGAAIGAVGGSSGPLPARTPRKPAWDRKCIFGARSPGIAIPETAVKAVQIVTDMRKLDVRDTTLAVAMLLRHLIEASDEHYRKRYRIGDQGLAKNVLASANRMFSKGELDKNQFDIVNRLAASTSKELLHIEALQKMMHRDTHLPDYQVINTFWDNIGDFVRKCWLK